MEMRLPLWARLAIGLSALMQAGFAVTLFLSPERIGDVWPWALPPLSTRLLGASSLVSVVMSALLLAINRYAAARIALVMMATYRVLQIAAGLIHADRFGGVTLTSINYFGGGAAMLAVFIYCLVAGERGALPPASTASPLSAPMPWGAGGALRAALALLAAIYVAVGLGFLALGGQAAPFWLDGDGLTALTARLFASPLTGLGLGLFLVSRAADWRATFIPATGLVTIGIVGNLSLFLDRGTLVLPTPGAWLVAATPAILLVAGAAILATRPRRPGTP